MRNSVGAATIADVPEMKPKNSAAKTEQSAQPESPAGEGAPASSTSGVPTVRGGCAKLALENGAVFVGRGFGASGRSEGEVVFNTSMTGYQEILTDPSYKGQIVTMTYPLIGNYGINSQDVESKGPHVAGFVVRELAPVYSNWRADRSLDEYLKQNGIIGIEGIDTRALTRMLREKGAMRGVLWAEDTSIRPAKPDRMETSEEDPSPLPLVSQATLRPEYRERGEEEEARAAAEAMRVPTDEELVGLARAAAGMAGADWVQAVKPAKGYSWSEGPLAAWELTPVEAGAGLRVVAIDCGAKQNILRHLRQRGLEVIALPADATAEQILAQKPDGLFISNGPGDPAALDYAVRPIAALVGKVPIFGICLGQQLLGRALGASTFKLKFGHRGANQPVKNLPTGRVEITSQNHGFAVDQKSLEANGGVVTHVNLNDGTVEGFRHRDLPLFCVQYHPEASPGPHDAVYLFDAFIEMMKTGKAPSDERLAELQKMREPRT